MFGFINLSKPAGVTSRAAINKVKHLVKPAKIGHTGTLDPLATGVLVTAVGPATRLAQFVQDMPKRYVGRFRLGYQSPTEDIEGDVEQLSNAPEVSRQQLLDVLPNFTGPIEQMPPQFSALKVNGKRAYDLARAGKEVPLKSRVVNIYKLALTSFEFPDFELAIECGAGTYIRSLGRDIARAVGTQTIMTGLKRTAVGTFDIETAIAPNSIEASNIASQVLPPQLALPDLPQIIIEPTVVRQLENAVPWQPQSELDLPEQVLAIDGNQRLIAVLKRREKGDYTPAINFSPYWKK